MLRKLYLLFITIVIIFLEVYAIHKGIDGKVMTITIGSLTFFVGLLFPEEVKRKIIITREIMKK